MACRSIETLSTTAEFGDSGVLVNARSNELLHSAMMPCCNPSKVYDFDESGCISYCNITAEADAIFWDFCLSDTLDPNTYTTIDKRCVIPSDVLDQSPNASATGVIATTWTAPNPELTTTLENNEVDTTLTETFYEYSCYVSNSMSPRRATTSGSSTVVSGTGSETTGASTSGPASTPTATLSAPSSTTSLSRAITGFAISKMKIAALGGLVFLVLLIQGPYM